MLNQDDGILTADEIAFPPLDGVNLVALSACETGLGEVVGGDEKDHLRRTPPEYWAAFVLSGDWR